MATTGQTYSVQAYPAADATGVRGQGVLYDGYANRRLEPRGVCVLSLKVQTAEHEGVGLLRDISQTGLFFYCTLSPAVGSEIEVTIRPSVVDSKMVVRCRCRVVRIEASMPGAAMGVGVAIQEYLGEDAQAERTVADCGEFSS